MNTYTKSDLYAKAKIEEPNLRLPTAVLKVNTDPSTGDLCYMKIFQDDMKSAKHLAEAIDGGAKLDRKIYRIRNMELFKAIGDEFEDMTQIQKAAKATIGLLVDPEADRHCHSYIDLVGTAEQVKMAEELILDKILQTYNGPVFPIILMPPTVYGHTMKLDASKVSRLIGKDAQNIMAMELVSGAWMQVDDQPPADGPENERIVNIYGPKAHVYKAVSLIYSQVFQPGECAEAEEELEKLFKELNFGELMEGLNSRVPGIMDFLAAATSGSGGTEEHAGSSSGVTEEHKDESEEKKQQREKEGVEEGGSGEASEPKESGEQHD